MSLPFSICGLSGDDVVDGDLPGGKCLSERMEPTLTLMRLPRLESAPPSFVLNEDSAAPAFPALRSGLVLALDPRLGLKTSFNLPTGDGDRFCRSAGARRLFDETPGFDSEEARLSVLSGNVEALLISYNCASKV